MNKIKDVILKKYIDLRLKLFPPDKEARNFPQLIREIKNILVLLPAQSAWEDDFQRFTSDLYKVFPEASISTFERRSFRKSDGNWMGLPSDAYMSQFTEVQFDLVIDLTPESDRLSTYICALSGAPLRMRLSEGGLSHIYNLHVRTDPQKPQKEKLKSITEQLRVFKKGTHPQ
ncbi:MAG TPA: hypothetical protein ENK44_05855 [Caldithrix abyssi]|uniref:Uncharacterized protein n=1 Tax=Caldithrix abyssi TaxID=187145 RepID=A0A7V4TZK3_CALAY|nr:hypothetical protein [Caldithrix abyssi]